MNSQPETTITLFQFSPAPLSVPYRQRTPLPHARLRSAFRLCRKHAAERQKELDQADLAAALIGDIQEFRSAADINHSLGELYKLQARNKITPRRAAVLAYTCNLLLRTLPAIDRELNPPDKEPQIIFDLPRPKRDWPEDPERAAYTRFSAHSAPNDTNAPNTMNTKESS